MQPKPFLDLAQSLSRKSSNEAALRTSVSRSYYALFNLLKQFLKDNNFSLPKAAAAHGIVYHALYHCDVDEAASIAKDLDELREDRNDADYDLELTKFQEANTVVLLFLKAQTAYNGFEQLVGNRANRRKVVEGVRSYRKKAPW